METEQKTRKKPNQLKTWFFYERFSYFDLIVIFGGIIPIFNWFLSHLSWS